MKKKSLIIILKVLDAKTKSLAINRQSDFDFEPVSQLSRVEVGSNTSTVALRVVGVEENGTECLEL
jgi:hypothetical protein